MSLKRIPWRYVLPALQLAAVVLATLLGPAAFRSSVFLVNLPALVASVATVISASELAGVEIADDVILWGTGIFLLPLWYALGRWVDRLTGSLPRREVSTTEMAFIGDIALLLLLGLLLNIAFGATLNVSIGTKLPNLELKTAVIAWLALCVALVLVRVGRRVWARRRAAE